MIVESIHQLKRFALSTQCLDCRDEALELLEKLTEEGVQVVRVYFDTDCHHAEGEPEEEFERRTR